MFEQTRSSVAKRLSALLDRFEAIQGRAADLRSEGQQAVRLGLGDDGKLLTILDEIISKSQEQAGLCGESITLLLVERAFPPMFKRGVTKAEAFAAQCEAILDQCDDATQSAKEAFRDRVGIRN